MLKLKSIVLGLMPITLLAIMLTGGWQLYGTNDVLLWGGLILSAAPGLLFLGWTIVLKRLNRSERLALVTVVVSLAGTAITTVSAFSGQSPETGSTVLGLSFAFFAGLIHFAYFGWATNLHREESVLIGRGSPLPIFQLQAGSGPITSDAFLGKPTILIFYRGNWCPFCMAQIEEVAREYRELVSSGVNFALISPQPEKITQKLARRFNVPFMFLVDENNRAAKVLGIDHAQGLPLGLKAQGYSEDTVFPTVIVTNERGTIVYCDQTTNFTIRPKPADYLRSIAQPNKV